MLHSSLLCLFRVHFCIRLSIVLFTDNLRKNSSHSFAWMTRSTFSDAITFLLPGARLSAPPHNQQRGCRRPGDAPPQIRHLGLQVRLEGLEAQVQGQVRQGQRVEAPRQEGEQGEGQGRQPERVRVQVELGGEEEVGGGRAQSEEGRRGAGRVLQVAVQLGRQQEEGERFHGVDEERYVGRCKLHEMVRLKQCKR